MEINSAVSATNFSLFRFLFGMLMIPEIIYLVPFLHDLSNSTFVFHYPYLSIIEAYSHTLLAVLEGTALIGAILLALGILARVGALMFLVSFGYLFLIDMSNYNNHYYLWCLLAFLFAVVDTHKSISIIDVIKRRTNKKMSILNYVPFALMVSIVYFYGAVVKINPDWLEGYPMRIFTTSRNYPYPHVLAYVMSYMGILFDGSMAFVLWRKPKAWYVVIPLLVFHLTNYFVFNIGSFPLVMLATWFIYLSLSTFSFGQLYQLVKNNFRFSARQLLIALFFAFQIIFPLRFLLMDGNVAWHRQGYYFSWRMMLNSSEAKYFQFFVDIPDKNYKYAVDFQKLLTYQQYFYTYNDPYFIWSLAQKLHKDAQKKYGSKQVKVTAKATISLNQHAAKDLINDTVNLAQMPYYLYHNNSFINK